MTNADTIREWVATRDREEGCWVPEWKTRTWGGYSQVRFGGRVVAAHRLALALSMGLEDGRELPRGLVVDHLCRRRECLNPLHLELVTQRVNTLRGVGPSADHATRTRCPRGHELVEGDLVAAQLRLGRRQCLTCNRVHSALKNRLRDKELTATLYRTIDLSDATPDTAADLAREFADAYIHEGGDAS